MGKWVLGVPAAGAGAGHIYTPLGSNVRGRNSLPGYNLQPHGGGLTVSQHRNTEAEDSGTKGWGVAASALPLSLIHRSAWNRNSPKFISKIVHSLTPLPLKRPVQAPCIAPPDTACNPDG